MSNALAISAVSAVLQNLLNTVYVSAGLGNVTVSAVAPDLAQADVARGTDYPLTVNLFLHQVTLNPAWRNIGLPSLAADGFTPLNNPPVALDLHYLLTAYASVDFLAEALLGFGVQLLCQTALLTRSQIRSALSNVSGSDPKNPLVGVLISSGLADQIELIKITPATLGREEMAWLWTALKADYRPTFPFQVSVVLIQSPASVQSALPVLTRTVIAQPNIISPLPTLTEANPQDNQPAAWLGATVTVAGSNLLGVTGVTLSNARQAVQQSITFPPTTASGSFTFTVPSPPAPSAGTAPSDLPVGVYLLTAQVGSTLTTNGVPLAIAPQIGSSWNPGTVPSVSQGPLTIPCTPFLRPGQQVSLVIGDQEILADPFPVVAGVAVATNTPSFTYSTLQPTGGPVPVRLRVDGIDSPILNLTTLGSPTFSPLTMVQVI